MKNGMVLSVIRTLRPIIIKEFRQIRRDPTSLGLLLVFPTILIVLVGYALNFDVKHIPLALLDENKSPQSREFLEQFLHTQYFDPEYTISSYDQIEELFMDGRVKVALIIPPDFGRDVLAGRETHVQALLDGSDANSASQAAMYVSRMTSDFSNSLVADAYWRKGRTLFVPIDFEPRIWYNPDLESSKFLIPGLIGFIIVLTAVISTSLTVVREKERGTMEQIMVSPLRPAEVILGKTIPYFFISLGAATGILLIGYVMFGIEVKGSLILLYAAICTIVFGALGQGLLISTITDSQQVAFMISVLSSLLPSFLLSGFIFPVANMPVVLQVLSNLAVNKFFLVVVRSVMLKGIGFGAVWEQFLYMIIFAGIMLTVSVRRMQKRTG